MLPSPSPSLLPDDEAPPAPLGPGGKPWPEQLNEELIATALDKYKKPTDKKKLTFAEAKAMGLIKFQDRRKITDISKVPIWVKLAIAYMDVMGLTSREAMERIGRKKGLSALAEWRNSPAVKEWRRGLKGLSVLHDQREMALAVIRTSSLGVTLDKLTALQMAMNAGDYMAVHRITSDLLDRSEVSGKKGLDKGAEFHVHLGNVSLDPQTVLSEVKGAIQEGEFEIEG